MWFEFFIYGLILSGPVWVYQNTQGRGNVLEIPLWMQKPWVSILTAIYSLSLIVFIVFGFGTFYVFSFLVSKTFILMYYTRITYMVFFALFLFFS